MKEINGHPYSLKATSPNRIQELDNVDQMLRDYNETADELYLFDAEFRAKYFKAVADVIIEFDDDFNPTLDFYQDGDLEISKLQEARRAFLTGAGMIGV